MAAFTYQPNSTTRHVGTGSADSLSVPAASALANGKNFVAGFAAGDTITVTGFVSAQHAPLVKSGPFVLLGPSQVPIVFFEDDVSTAATVNTSA